MLCVLDVDFKNHKLGLITCGKAHGKFCYNTLVTLELRYVRQRIRNCVWILFYDGRLRTFPRNRANISNDDHVGYE